MKKSPKKPRREIRRLADQPNLRRVARERRAFQRQVDHERTLRYRAFLARAAAARKPGAALAAAAVLAPPVTILAEGDSWFEYPVPLSGGGVIDHLEDRLGDRALVCNLAHHGDEVRQMLGLAQRRELEKRLGDPKVRFDALLFSGGGNDLVGDQFCLWLHPMSPGATPDQLLDQPRVKAVLDVVEAGFRDLVAIRDRLSPATKIFVHGYDFPQPSNQGVCGVGPWMKPSLDYRGITGAADQAGVVQVLLERLAAMLQRIAADPAVAGFILVPTQGTLNRATDWGNEIHPNRQGFEKIAAVFQTALRRHWPQL